jgi:hypothetical protein
MDRPGKSFWKDWPMLLVIVVGFSARLLAAKYGHNYDIDSYQIVSGIVDHGGNVYAGTDRYNYGPVWFHIVHAVSVLAWHNQTVFRYLLAGLLSLVDVGIGCILWRKFGRLAACLFFLNPISVIITGYHSQFDNLAILLGLLSVLLVGDEFDRPVGRRKFAGLLVLGLSLATKHVLFAFPFWLAVKQKGFRQKLVVLLTPVLVFLLGFVPYWPEGRHGIIRNVFLYQSEYEEIFYHAFVPAGLQFIYSSLKTWLLLLAVFAFVCRRKNAVESLLLYTCVMVGTSPAIASQYLAIPVAFAAANLNLFTLLFTVTGTLQVLTNPAELGLIPAGSMETITLWFRVVPIYCLCYAVVWITWREKIMALVKLCLQEIKDQFDFKP